MFSIRRPTQDAIRLGIAKARLDRLGYTVPINTQNGPDTTEVPAGFIQDHTRSQIGSGSLAFQAAKTAFGLWLHFALGWVHVANTDAKIAVDEVVAVKAYTLKLWSVNFSPHTLCHRRASPLRIWLRNNYAPCRTRRRTLPPRIRTDFRSSLIRSAGSLTASLLVCATGLFLHPRPAAAVRP